MATCSGYWIESAGQAIWQSFDRHQKVKVFVGSRKQNHTELTALKVNQNVKASG